MHAQSNRTHLAKRCSLLLIAVLTQSCVTTGDLQQASRWAATLPTNLQAQPGAAPVARSPATDRATGMEGATLTSAERRLRDQGQAFHRTVWEGALIGAGAGALWGVLRGDKAKDVLQKAMIGAAAGGLAGAYLAHVQQRYSKQEDQLEAMIADLREDNTRTEAFIVSVREVIAEDRRRLAAVRARQRQGQATAAELAAAQRRASENRMVIAQASAGAREKQAMYQGAVREFRRTNPGADGLQQELDAFNRNLRTLDALAESIEVA
ncbi:MAG: hypothetical protein EA400_06985 [Chromatiaceae bacterium]|nr:MAG: hypothetical protein EA400_06985 [Chromatiaceae bacterium]